MKREARLELTVAEDSDAGSVVRKRAVLKLKELEDGSFQPILSVRNSESGLEVDTKLPKVDFSKVFDKLSLEFNSQGIEKLGKKIAMLVYFLK